MNLEIREGGSSRHIVRRQRDVSSKRLRKTANTSARTANLATDIRTQILLSKTQEDLDTTSRANIVRPFVPILMPGHSEDTHDYQYSQSSKQERYKH
jgi:hypothetical protein